MNMMESTLKKLNEKQLSYCKVCADVINEAFEKNLKTLYESEMSHLKGYLKCMEDMDILSTAESKALYEYFILGDED